MWRLPSGELLSPPSEWPQAILQGQNSLSTFQGRYWKEIKIRFHTWTRAFTGDTGSHQRTMLGSHPQNSATWIDHLRATGHLRALFLAVQAPVFRMLQDLAQWWTLRQLSLPRLSRPKVPKRPVAFNRMWHFSESGTPIWSSRRWFECLRSYRYHTMFGSERSVFSSL